MASTMTAQLDEMHHAFYGTLPRRDRIILRVMRVVMGLALSIFYVSTMIVLQWGPRCCGMGWLIQVRPSWSRVFAQCRQMMMSAPVPVPRERVVRPQVWNVQPPVWNPAWQPAPAFGR